MISGDYFKIFLINYICSLLERTRVEKSTIKLGFDWLIYQIALANNWLPVRLPFFRQAGDVTPKTKTEERKKKTSAEIKITSLTELKTKTPNELMDLARYVIFIKFFLQIFDRLPLPNGPSQPLAYRCNVLGVLPCLIFRDLFQNLLLQFVHFKYHPFCLKNTIYLIRMMEFTRMEILNSLQLINPTELK